MIFESDTRAGRTFDVALLVAIPASAVTVMIDRGEPVSACRAGLDAATG
ncbi:MAG: hypothetical protein HY749_24080 [Gammaproteobacteria bacterium]|nr:hypothetical protein [Gammaproteobacteria bacterium]MBI5615999.1 hypothetical protein [Gammaproteobacteria bacterium]